MENNNWMGQYINPFAFLYQKDSPARCQQLAEHAQRVFAEQYAAMYQKSLSPQGLKVAEYVHNMIGESPAAPSPQTQLVSAIQNRIVTLHAEIDSRKTELANMENLLARIESDPDLLSIAEQIAKLRQGK